MHRAAIRSGLVLFLLGLIFSQVARPQGTELNRTDFKLIRPISPGILEEAKSLSFSADGKRIAVGGDRSRVYEVATGKSLAARAFLSGSELLSFGPAGKLIAAGSFGGEVRLLDAANLQDQGGQKATAMQHQPNDGVSRSVTITDVKFSPNGKFVASASLNGQVKIWDVSTRKNTQTFSGHNHSVLALAYAPDGQTIASGGKDGTLKIWSSSTGEEKASYQVNASPLTAVAYNTAGKVIALGSADGTVTLWDVTNNKKLGEFKEKLNVSSIAFNSSGKQLAVGGATGVGVWDPIAMKKLGALGPKEAKAPVAFSPDGKMLATGWYDRPEGLSLPRMGVRLWDTNAKGEPAGSADLGPVAGGGGPFVGGGAGGGKDDLLKKLRRAPGTKHFNPDLGGVAFSPDGTLVACRASGPEVTLFEVATLKERARLKSPRGWLGSAFSSDGKRFAAPGQPGEIKQWNIANGEEQPALLKLNGPIPMHQLSPDWKVAAGYEQSVTLRLYDVDTREPGPIINHPGDPKRNLLRRLDLEPDKRGGPQLSPEMGTSRGQGIAFTPDGNAFATTGSDSSVRLWHVKTGKEIRGYFGHEAPFVLLQFSPDGKWLAAVGLDRQISVWDVATAEKKAGMALMAGMVSCFAISPDGKTLAAGSDTTAEGLMRPVIRLWELQTGRALGAVVTTHGRVRGLAFSPDGKLLASFGSEGEDGLILWSVGPGASR